MPSSNKTATVLDDVKIPVRANLSALWTRRNLTLTGGPIGMRAVSYVVDPALGRALGPTE